MKPYRLVIFIFFILCPTWIFALKTDRSQKIVIHATNLDADTDIKNLEIYGDVYITQGSMSIKGDTLTVKTVSENEKVITVTGNPASFKQTLDAKNKLGKNKIFTADSRKAVYNTKTKTINLMGNANAKIDKDKISGNSIFYNTVTEQYKIKGNGKNKATIVIYPK